jgi:hypothetical protein
VDQRGIHIFGKNMGKNMRKIIENPLKILKILKNCGYHGIFGGTNSYGDMIRGSIPSGNLTVCHGK